MSEEQFEAQIATVAGKYPGEAGSDTLTFSHATDSSNKLLDYEMETKESCPGRVALRFDNLDGSLIGATYDATAGSGPLATGLQVHFYTWPTKTDTRTLEFNGYITEILDTGDGVLEIICESELVKADGFALNRYYADQYREEYETRLYYGPWPCEVYTLDDWVEPVLWIQLCVNADDEILSTHESATGWHNMTASTHWICQEFRVSGDHINVMIFRTTGGAANTATIEAGIYETDSSGKPIGGALCHNQYGPYANHPNEHEPHMVPDHRVDMLSYMTWAKRLVKGKRYCLLLSPSGTLSVVDIYVRIADPSAGTMRAKTTTNSGGTWTEATFGLAPFEIFWSPWQEMAQEDCYKDITLPTDIIVSGYGRADMPSGDEGSANVKRAIATYFYGSVTAHVVLENLLAVSFPNVEVDTGITGTFGIYSTMGKSPLECVREICGLVDPGLSRKLVVFDCWVSVRAWIVIVGTYNTGDPSYATFSDDPANEDECIILDNALEKKDARKVNTVEVIGEAAGKKPVFATAVDWASRGKIGCVMHSVTDKNLHNYSDCYREALRILDAINRTEWEGAIIVPGCFSELVDDSAGSAGTVRGGRIVTLTLSTKNISAEKFKVKGIVVTPGKTVINITNCDLSAEDELRSIEEGTKLAESFTASLDAVKEGYFKCRQATVAADASLYMELQTSAGTAIAGQRRRLCTKRAAGAYNIYHAIFEPGNAYTASGAANMVGRIALYTEFSGGTRRAYYDVPAAERFYKLKISRMTVDMTCDAS